MSDIPGPERFTVEYIDEQREHYGFSRSEFSRRAGREVGAWSEIVTQGIDPQASTLRAFIRVLDEADPNGDRPRRGCKPTPVGELRGDGGSIQGGEHR